MASCIIYFGERTVCGLKKLWFAVSEQITERIEFFWWKWWVEISNDLTKLYTHKHILNTCYAGDKDA